MTRPALGSGSAPLLCVVSVVFLGWSFEGNVSGTLITCSTLQLIVGSRRVMI
ncbi:hypothetical protein SISSUDRAFT_1053307 [Sistotremastrum suecicum HHB10207 ss-3]|uniref:Uncharacterized protein n=1 Tax=Sistotremastrum suecicum HHB10207 ss-3 TaxID=1314776 RepID=A0A165ZBH8_9AGAM|nr:hypothetical protein SISSUDRAFT_1053307 [Sistotremastrum suecicum HHB10207 ss-3]